MTQVIIALQISSAAIVFSLSFYVMGSKIISKLAK